MSQDFLIHEFKTIRWLGVRGADEAAWKKSLAAENIVLPDNLTHRTEWPEFHDLDDGRAMASLHFPDIDQPTRQSSELKLLIEADRLVMIYSSEFPAIEAVKRLIGTSQLPEDASPTRLTCSVLTALVDTRLQILDRLNLECTRLEEGVFSHDGTDFIVDLMQLRKSIATLRRIVIPQREVVRQLAVHLHAQCNKPDKNCHRESSLITRVHARIGHVETRLTALHEKADQITDANEAFLTHSLNRTLKLLTGVSVIVAPPTLIAGLWGMNTNVPGQGEMSGFVLVVLMILVTSVATTLFFRRKDWL